MSDIVERLRANLHKYPGFVNLSEEAANEIKSLREAVRVLGAEVRRRRRGARADEPQGYMESLCAATDANPIASAAVEKGGVG